jgi:hypothetical protein
LKIVDDSNWQQRWIVIVSTIVAVAAAVWAFISFIGQGGQQADDVSSWTTGLAILSALLAFISGVVTLLRNLRNARKRRTVEIEIDQLRQAPAPTAAAASHELRRVLAYETASTEAESMIRHFLPVNPRSAKRLVNHLRLALAIAADRRVFGGVPAVTPSHLAKWVLISEHWSRLATVLVDDPNRMAHLESARDLEALMQSLRQIASDVKASSELLAVLSLHPPLHPVLVRLVRFEPAETADVARGS